MLTLVQLVEILQQTQVVSPTHMNRLRRIAEASPKEFTPTIALRWLIEQKQLTKGQAERLVVLVDPELAASLNERHDDAPIPLDDVPSKRDLSTSPQIPVRTPWTNPSDPAGPNAPRTPLTLTFADEPDTRPAEQLPTAERIAPTQAAPIVPLATPSRGLIDDLLDAAAPSNPLTAASPGLLNVAPPAKRVAGTWDSPLLLVGGGALLLMCIVGTVLWFALGRESGDELLRLADDDVRQGAFDQAIFKFDRFIASHGSHPRASDARVQRGTARLRKAVDTTSDWPANLALAKRVVDEIAGEKSFAEARPELASLLPRIAEQLAKAAVEQSGEAELNAARESFELASKPQLIPEALRPTVKLQEIEQLLRLAERRQQRAQSLDEAAKVIATAAQSGDFGTGFDRHRQLLHAYPDLRDHVKLVEALQSLSAGLRDAVKHEPLKVAAANDEPPTIVTRSVTPVLYATDVPPEAQADGDVAVVPIDGSAYGFEVATGRALWRRYIGRGGYTLRVDATPASDALVVDAVRNELMRLDARSGAIRWRTSCDKPITATPTILRGAALVVSSGGTLHQVDLTHGTITDRWRLPQGISTAAIVDPSESLIYVVADHSHLFVLSRTKKSCVEVVSLGHAAGQIVVPPVVIGRHLFVAQNQTSEAGLLRGLIANVDGVELKPMVSQPYRGQITTPLVAQGRALALVNEFGAVTLYEIGAGEPTSTLKTLVEQPRDNDPPLSRYLHMSGDKLSIGGYEMTVNELHHARGRVARLWASSGHDPIVAPPQIVADRVIFVRRSTAHSAWIVEGAEPVTSGKRWQTRLAAPVQVVAATDQQSLQLVTSTGDTIRVSRDSAEGTTFAGVKHTAGLPLDVLDALPLDDTRWLALTRDQRLLQIGAADKKPELLRDKVSAGATIFQGNTLVPRLLGQIEALRPADMSRAWEPFQPSLTPGVDYLWTKPAIAADGQSFVVSDRRTNVYRVGLKQQPRAHLAALQTLSVAEPVEALIVAGESVYGRDRLGRITALALDDLKPGTHWDLNTTPDGGPWLAGSRALVQSAAGELWCLAAGQAAWHVVWPHGTITGEPFVAGDSAWIATRGGSVVRVNLVDGTSTLLANVAQPLVGSPLQLGDRWLVTSTDGTLLWLDVTRSTP